MPPIPGFLLSWAQMVSCLPMTWFEKMQQHGGHWCRCEPRLYPTDKPRQISGQWRASVEKLTMNGVEALKRAQMDFLVQTSVTQWNYEEIPKYRRVRL